MRLVGINGERVGKNVKTVGITLDKGFILKKYDLNVVVCASYGQTSQCVHFKRT